LTCTTLEVTLDGSGSSTNPDADLSYAWIGPNGYSAITEDITVSEVGTYTLTVTDNDNGCSAMSAAEVTQDDNKPSAEAGADAELTCTTLEVTLDGSGSSTNPDADLSYAWIGPNGYSAITEDITVSEVGTYTLTVTDNDNGCSAMSDAEVIKEIIDLQLSYTDVTCFGLDDGMITISFVSEGALVTVNGNPYDADMLYEPGTYIVVAYFDGSADQDCMTSQDIIIIEPDLVDVQVSSTDVTTCYGGADGTITIESLSEGAFYTIKLNGTGPDLSGQDYFAAGTYVVEARLIDNLLTRMGSVGEKDLSARAQNPCIDGKLVVIGQPEEIICRISKSYSGNEIRCNDRTNNDLTVTYSGGVGPYTYLWTMDKSAYYGIWQIQSGSEDQTMIFTPGMGIATFTIEVTDANGCTTTCEIELNSTCTKVDYYNSFFRQAEFDFEMFPNPTKGKLTIKPNKLSGNSATVELYDLIGTRILNQTFSKISDKGININLSGLASQVYYLKVITKDGTKIKKVVLDK
ncbi:T9SS type A sorting domain-containing protein, partial [Psychroserpens sp.]